MSKIAKPEEIIARVPEWQGKDCQITVLRGGLANHNYIATIDGERFVIKAITQAMGDFSLMIPVPDLLANSVKAGETGIGPKVFHVFPDLPALVMEFVDGQTLQTSNLSEEAYIPRLGKTIASLHSTCAPFDNSIDIWDFLDDYLKLVNDHGLETPDGILAAEPVLRRVQAALAVNALPRVSSHNDLLPLNIMDDGRIRLVDYDFSGLSDPIFDLGGLAMEGLLDLDQTAKLCEAYFGHHDPVQVARASLFGIAAQYTWSLLFVGMGALLPEAPDENFDYFAEAVSRWKWTQEHLDDTYVSELIAAATAGT